MMDENRRKGQDKADTTSKVTKQGRGNQPTAQNQKAKPSWSSQELFIGISKWIRQSPARKHRYIGEWLVEILYAAARKETATLEAIATQTGGLLSEIARVASEDTKKGHIGAAIKPAWESLRLLFLQSASGRAVVNKFCDEFLGLRGEESAAPCHADKNRVT